jgi:hypothetical protein
LESHPEEERTSVRTATLRWFSRGREDGGRAEETDDDGWKTDCDSTLGVRIQRRVGQEWVEICVTIVGQSLRGMTEVDGLDEREVVRFDSEVISLYIWK